MDESREAQAVARARSLFLRDDNRYGCAEATLLVLRESFESANAADSSAAMALNGGFAYSGGICGALSGAALAVGELAGRRFDDHQTAKRRARSVVQDLARRFKDEFGASNCIELIGVDISDPVRHDAFIAGGVWRDACMRQIEFAVRALHDLSRVKDWEDFTTRTECEEVREHTEGSRAGPDHHPLTGPTLSNNVDTR